MKLVLTNKGDNRELLVEAEDISLAEVAQDGTGVGSHLVFDNGYGRNVNESLASIVAVTGAVVVPALPADTTVASVAKKAKAKR